MTDYGYIERQKFIAQTHPHGSLEAKRERALQWLGDKWILHAKHSVKKIANPGVLGRAMQ